MNDFMRGFGICLCLFAITVLAVVGLAQAPAPQGPVQHVLLNRPAVQPPQFDVTVQVASGKQVIVTAPNGFITTKPGFISGTTQYIIDVAPKGPGQP